MGGGTIVRRVPLIGGIASLLLSDAKNVFIPMRWKSYGSASQPSPPSEGA